MHTVALLAITTFCRISAPTALAYAPDALVEAYPVTNIVWHVDPSVDPPREWAETNVVTRHRTNLAPTDADYLAANWLRNAVTAPTNRAGYVARLDRYEARGEAVYALYAYEPLPPPPRKFSKLRIYGAIVSLPERNGVSAWDTIKAWLEGKTVDGINGWQAFELAQEVSEDHPLFAPLAEEARQLLGLSDEQFDALLAECILEGN